MHPKSNREEIEKRILDLADAVPVQQSNWVESKELDELLSAWRDLVSYYEAHADAGVNWMIIGEFVAYTRLFRRVMCDEKQSDDIRKKAEEELVSFETTMELLLRETVSNQEYKNDTKNGEK